MIRRILAGVAIAGFLGAAGMATAAAASADNWDKPGTTYVENHENNVLNDLIDLALLGFIEND
ncbi:hypothetical protein ACFFMN_36730 [Planobispora siamensis]|uniref:Uncharacterized protein n=1 Tax=Planobispora siamensis TaxID=936338 RepID=A0A8J3SNQ2_9ACTN|nr:hypothetical protein [Planobispora siamensis]GIH96147.1 hypothetical protein Psi01_67770 [Planobispora siamensis]